MYATQAADSSAKARLLLRKSLELLTQSLTSVSPPTLPTPLDGKSCNSSALAIPLVQIQGHPSQNPTRIDIIPR